MKELKFLITCRQYHPYIGGTKIDVYEYELAAFISMEKKYKELSKNDWAYQHTNVTIIHKEKEL